VIIQQIVAVLTAERNLLDRAISALNGISPQPRRGRPPKAAQTLARPKHGRMSAAARKKMSRLLKQRWAQGKMGRRGKAR